MECVKQLCRNHLRLDNLTGPVRSVLTQGTTAEKVQLVVSCLGVVCSIICLALGIAAAAVGVSCSGFAIGLGVIAILLGIVLFAISALDVLEDRGLVGCPFKLPCKSSPANEPTVQFFKGKNGSADQVILVTQ